MHQHIFHIPEPWLFGVHPIVLLARANAGRWLLYHFSVYVLFCCSFFSFIVVSIISHSLIRFKFICCFEFFHLFFACFRLFFNFSLFFVRCFVSIFFHLLSSDFYAKSNFYISLDFCFHFAVGLLYFWSGWFFFVFVDSPFLLFALLLIFMFEHCFVDLNCSCFALLSRAPSRCKNSNTNH